jgi:hypothetical protein
MSQITIATDLQHQSPFDVIRGYRADGSEYWTARELLKWLGYKSWQFGEKAILRTIKSLKNQGFDTTEHVMQVHKLVSRLSRGNTEIVDYELSRLACYTVAMNADPEKEMVALAQGYFAIKTRQAEVIIPAQNERLLDLELELQLVKAKTDCYLSEQKLIDTRHLITTTLPEPLQQKILGYQVVERVEYRDRVIRSGQVINDGSTLNKTELCSRYGFLKNGKPDYKRLNSYLDRLNLPRQMWSEVDAVRTNLEFKCEHLLELDRAIYSADERQLWVGER